MILKAEILLDVDKEIVQARDIAALIEQVFKDNDHVVKLIICDVKETEKKHQYEFYANGSLCKTCGAQIGSGYPCR